MNDSSYKMNLINCQAGEIILKNPEGINTLRDTLFVFFSETRSKRQNTRSNQELGRDHVEEDPQDEFTQKERGKGQISNNSAALENVIIFGRQGVQRGGSISYHLKEGDKRQKVQEIL